MCAALAACTSGERPLRLGTTTTVEQSGALALLDSLAHPAPSVVVGPSGQVLAAAARGDLDLVLTHAPSLERRLLVGPGHAVLECPFVASRFAVVGPATDPARVAAAGSAAEAFRRIARGGRPFVSRADSSGTNVKELALWRAAGVTPGPPWYIESGTDQAATLHLADERTAYALADLPTYAKLGRLGLRVLFTADTALANPYTLYVVRGAGADARAREFALWAVRVVRPAVLALRLPDQTPAFVARPGGCTVPPPAGASAATAKS
jgi:tungstate transport system substrate-binding protein